MRRALRITAWSLGSLVALLATISLIVLVGSNTNAGRHAIEQLTARLTSGRVRLSGLAGSFPTRIEAERLELADARGVWLTAERVELHWSPTALLFRHVDIDRLEIAHLDIERRPLPEPSSEKENNQLPRVDLHRLVIGNLILEPALAGSRAALTLQATLHLVSLSDAAASLRAQRTDGPGGDYQLALRFDQARMDANLRLDEPAGGALENLLQFPGLGGVSIEARLSGPRSDEQAVIHARAAGLQADAHGQVDLTHQSADLALQLDAAAMSPRPGLSWQRLGLQGHWRGSIRAPQADASLKIEGLQLPGDARVGSLQGLLHADGGVLDAHTIVDGIVLPGSEPRLLAGSPLRIDANARLDQPERPLQLNVEHRLLQLEAHARTAGDFSATFSLRLPELAPLAALSGLSLSGRSGLSGTLRRHSESTQLEVSAASDLAANQALPLALLAGKSRLQLAVKITERELEVERFSLATSSLTATASGSARRGSGADAPAVERLRVHYEANLADLATLSAVLGGTARVKGTLEGPVGALALQTQLSAAVSVRGAPREPINAEIRARGLPQLTNATVTASGTLLGAPLELDTSAQRLTGSTYRVTVQRANWKSAHLEGDLTSDAHLAGGHGSLQLRMDRLADLQPLLGTGLQGSIVAALTLRPVARGTFADAHLDAQRLDLGGIAADAHLHASGTADSLNLKLDARAPDVRGAPAAIEATARLNVKARELQLERAVAQYQAQAVRLLAPSRLSFADGFAVRDLKLGLQHALIEVDGRLAPRLELRASVHRVDATLVSAFVPDMLAAGSLDLDAQLGGTLAAPTGEVRAHAKELRFATSTARDLRPINLEATARLQAKAVQLDARFNAGPGSELRLTGGAPLAADGALNLKLAGRLDAALANPLLEARGERAAGTLTVSAVVTGPLRTPQLGGTVDFAHGDLRDYTQGIHVSDITAHLVGSQGTLRIASLSGRATPGQISLTGTVGILQPQMPLDLHLTAKNAQPIASDILTSNFDADLTAKGTLRDHLDLAGTVSLNRTVIGIPNALPPEVAVLDVRRPGQAPAAPTASKLVIGLDLRLRAPREILVQGRGLNAELGGDLRVRGTSDSPRVSGGFDLIRGTFALASTQINFTSGRVSFNGAGLKNRIDPTLDFTAQSSASDATATLHITGFADAPQFALESSPQLPQDEILARLLFGVSASQLSALQLAQIGVALASLSGVGGSGPNPLARVQKALGLDRLSVGSGGPPSASGQSAGTSVEAGRYVSDRVFVGLRHSTTGFSQVEADVELSKHLKLQTRLGNGTATTQGTTPENDPGSSVGFVYQFEY